VSEQTHRERISVDHPATGRVNQPGREEGVVRAGAQPVEHERPEDWGWHGEAGRAGRVAGIVTIVFLLVLTQGNHEGHVEDVWLIGAALLIAISLLWDYRRRKNAWRSK
jgi:hypothetical protein